jgi:hypothetical protein
LEPTGHDLPLLESGQQLGLEVERQIAHLVEEQGAAVRRLQAADRGRPRVGEGALHMPEQLGFEEVLGDRAQVDRDHDIVGAARAAVKLARDELLAGAVLAEDQDIGLGRPGPVDQRIDRRIAAEVPSRGVSPPAVGAAMATARLRSVATAWRELRSDAAVRTVASSRSFDQGLETKSVAPRFIASTAMLTPPWR